MSVTIDPCLRVRPSQAMLDFIESAPEKPASLRNLTENSELELSDIKWLFSNQRDQKIGPKFHELMSGCEVVLPQPKFPPRNPVLEARVQKLKAQQENKDYWKMVENVDGTRSNKARPLDDEPIAKQSKWQTFH